MTELPGIATAEAEEPATAPRRRPAWRPALALPRGAWWFWWVAAGSLAALAFKVLSSCWSWGEVLGGPGSRLCGVGGAGGVLVAAALAALYEIRRNE